MENRNVETLKTSSGVVFERFTPYEDDPSRRGLIHESSAPFIPVAENQGTFKGNEDGSRVLEGLFQRANARNRNKRIYPQKILERETAKLKGVISENSGIFGELDHPETVVVQMKNACTRLDHLNMSPDGIVEGRMTLMPTLPFGKFAIGCADALGGKIGVSSRGAGTLLKGSNGDIMVGEDYNMRTYDCVHDPSTEGARPIMVAESLVLEYLDARPSTQRMMLGKVVEAYLFGKAGE